MLPLWAAVLLLGSAAANVPRAVVINLPRHEARLAKVREELQAAALPFERLPAVDGRALPAEALRANVTALGRHLLTPGMIGCFLSHRRCWLKCVETGEPLIVFEDDAVLMPNFRQRLQAAMADLPASWDILLLGAFGCVRPDGVYGPKNIFRLFGWVGGGTRRIRTLPGAAGLHVPWRPYGTHAYMVSPAGAKKLLAACPRANFHVDNVAWGVKSLELYCVHPLMAKQTHADTTVGGLSGEDWIPKFFTQVDPYTGVSFSWAWNTPVIKLGPTGILLTVGRTFASGMIALAAAILHAALTRSPTALIAWAGYAVAFGATIRLLSTQR